MSGTSPTTAAAGSAATGAKLLVVVMGVAWGDRKSVV